VTDRFLSIARYVASTGADGILGIWPLHRGGHPRARADTGTQTQGSDDRADLRTGTPPRNSQRRLRLNT
jgi:hypothetical protein